MLGSGVYNLYEKDDLCLIFCVCVSNQPYIHTADREFVTDLF